MTTRTLITTAVAVLAALVLCAGGIGALITADAATACAPAQTTSTPDPTSTARADRDQAPAGAWTDEQLANAAIIVSTGVRMRVPPRGWIIAVAVAIQESTLRNLKHGDRDSVGLFQQRPSQGWGTVEQLTNPSYAATMFYSKLQTIPGWEQMRLTDAAQAVQVSAYPLAYAKHEPAATQLVHAIASKYGWATPTDHPQCANTEWTTPVRAPVASGFRTTERPDHDGVDLGAARGTVIHAASSGQVARVRCNAIDERDGSNWGCDRDGDPNHTRGCGWYVDVDHPAGITTRYCHMLHEPLVKVGDRVTVGQPLGYVGSSGHSTGPHLHFEVHVNGEAGAIDPERWMRERGAPLGLRRG